MFTVIAWAFAHLFVVVQAIYPESFIAFENAKDPRTWSDLLFLSFTTLSSTGLSDIMPVKPHARSVVMFEQVAGVFYLAMVVTRLIGLSAMRKQTAVTTLQLALSALCAVVALGLVVLIVRDRLPGTLTLGALATLEAGLVVQLVIGLGRVFGDHGDLCVAAYVGYLVGALLILPIGFVWSAGERTRSGTAVLLVAVLALPVLFLRLHDLWAAR